MKNNQNSVEQVTQHCEQLQQAVLELKIAVDALLGLTDTVNKLADIREHLLDYEKTRNNEI